MTKKMDFLALCRVAMALAFLFMIAAAPYINFLNNSDKSPEEIITLNAFFDNDKLILEISSAPGSAIYSNKISITDDKNKKNLLENTSLPAPDSKLNLTEDEQNIPVYTSSKAIALQKEHLLDSLTIRLQACNVEDLFCYLPVAKQISWDKNKSTVIIEPVSQNNQDLPLPDNNDLEAPKDIYAHILKILACFAIGLTMAFTPCTFPLLPILLNTISDPKKNTKEKIPVAASYVIGMGVSYALIGLSFGFLSYNIQGYLQQKWCIYLFAVFLLIFSLIIMGYISIGSYSSSIEINRTNKYGKLHAFILGTISVLVISPCTTPVLASILLTSTQGIISPLHTSIWLLVFGIGSGIPLMVMAIFGVNIMPKSGIWLNVTKHILGLSVLAIAVWLVTRVHDNITATLFWGIYSIVCFLVISTNKQCYSNKLSLALKFITIVAGVFMIVSASIGKSVFDDNGQRGLFKIATNQQELQEHLQTAESESKTVLLKIHANWCTYCKKLNKDFFNNSNKQGLLNSKDIYYLEADVTNNNQFFIYLEQNWAIVGLPEIIILNTQSKEVNRLRGPSVQDVENAIHQLED